MKANRVCPTCGAKTVEYRHNMGRGLQVALLKLYRAGGGPVNVNSIGLTANQWTNFHKLRYWGLVQKSSRDDGKRIGGVWRLTPNGRDFVLGKTTVKKNAWSYRGNTVRFEGEQVEFSLPLADPAYKTRPEYAAEARPRAPDLFTP